MPKAQNIELKLDQVADIPIDLLIPDPDQPRKDFDEALLKSLADDIKKRGVLQPITVRQDELGNTYIKLGERRWRASKLAGMKFVPALLAPPEQGEVGPLDRAFDQLSENHQRKDLNPLEWGQFFLRLRDGYEMKIADIPAELEKRGIKNMSRSYISNLIRLVELPDWAQDKIKSGEWTAAHGKVLLTASGDEKVLKAIKKGDHRETEEDNEVPTTRELGEEIHDSFWALHIRLDNSYGDNAPKFNVKKECTGCANNREISSEWRASNFCTDKSCFRLKQEAAETKSKSGNSGTIASAATKKPTGPTKTKENKAGVVNTHNILSTGSERLEWAAFDQKECEGCEHNKLASYNGKKDNAAATCFNVPCFRKKVSGASREKGRRERVALILDDWARDQILPQLAGNYKLQMQLLVYMALGMPNNEIDDDDTDFIGRDDVRLQEKQDDVIKQTNILRLSDVLQSFEDGELPNEEIVAGGVRAMGRENLYRLAKHLDLAPDEKNFKITEAYVETHNKGSAGDLLTSNEIFKDSKDKLVAHGKLADLKETILSNADSIGVPADVLQVYAEYGQNEGIEIEGEVAD